MNTTKMLPKLQPKPRKIQPNTNAAHQKQKSNPSPQAVISSPYMSSSPFQMCQATAMTNPALPGDPRRFSPMSKSKSQQNSQSNSSPQPAHSQAITQPRYSVNSTLPAYSQPNRMYPRLTSSTPQPEVVDLTTKSPDKIANQSSQGISTHSPLNITTEPNPNKCYINNQTSVTLTKLSMPLTKSKGSVRSPSSTNSSNLMPREFRKLPQEMPYKSPPFATKPIIENKPTAQISRVTHLKSMQNSNLNSSFGTTTNTATGLYKSPPNLNSEPIVSITPVRQTEDLWNTCSSQDVTTPVISQNIYPNITKSAPSTVSRPLKRTSFYVYIYIIELCLLINWN